MSYSNNQLVGNGSATGAIPAFVIVAQDTATDGGVVVANGTNGKYLGIGPNYATISGTQIQYTFGGEAQVTVGAGGVTHGDPLTSDTNGFAITASLIQNNTTGANIPLIGKARKTGNANDIIPIQVFPNQV